MSTFGRDADRTAERKRRHERHLADKAITRDLAVRFSIATLQDPSIDAAQACALVLAALTLKDFK